jgi:hypothetical protein
MPFTPFKSALGLVCLFVLLSLSVLGQDRGVFSIKGKLAVDKVDIENCELILVNSEYLDSNRIELDNGKFEFLLGLNSTYLLLVRKNNAAVKKILISTAAPASPKGYKMKLTIDILEGRYSHGIVEYQGFEHRFIIKAMRANTLKRRKHEFLAFYEYMMSDIQ